jgi:hypothetical protein
VDFDSKTNPAAPPGDPIWNRKMTEDEMCPLDSPGPPPLKKGGKIHGMRFLFPPPFVASVLKVQQNCRSDEVVNARLTLRNTPV